MNERVCYRYRTPVLHGPWRRGRTSAQQDAIEAGQARLCGDRAEWCVVGGGIEASYCDQGGPCGGEYPPEDDDL